MKRNWRPLGLTRYCLVAMAALLFFACSNESSGPPTPPPPPPFQPQTIVVQLGERGGATTLISTQAGGWTRNGQPFTSGSTITGENAASYRLTLANGRWTAEFIAPDPEPLVLGTSGDAILLQAQENGSYLLDGEPVTANTVVEADNGNQYRLVRGSDGAWTAEFVPPAPQLVFLGSSGDSRQVSRLEGGGFTVDGRPLAPGEVVTAQNGNRYTFTFGTDGRWTAVYVEPDPQRLQLGTSGDPPLLVYRQENGTFELNGEPLLGGTVVQARNGSSYRLTIGPDRMWRAAYIPEDVSVQLGSSGEAVTLTPNEDGSWRRGSTLFSSGDTVMGANGFEYRLTLGADGWIVEALPMTVNVPVTGSDTTIALARLEDGTYLYNNRRVNSGDTVTAGESTYTLQFANNRWTAVFLRGEVLVSLGTEGDSVTLIKRADGTYEQLDGTRVRSGSIVRSPTTQTRYRLRFSNGVWTASLYVPPIPGGGDPGGDDTPPAVAEDILSALPEHLVTDGAFVSSPDQIKTDVSDADGQNYSAYHGGGRYEDDTFVESVIRAIDRILVPIETQGLADGTDSERFVAGILIDSYWDDVEDELELIFAGTDDISFMKPTDSSGTDVDESVAKLEDLREDLSDVAKFKDRFSTQITLADPVTGDQIYEARKRVLALGASTNTRFGVISTLASGTTAQAAAVGGAYTPIPFAFSPLDATPTSALPSDGTARYSGRTWAVDSSQVLYSGTVELLASLAISQVRGTVSNLRRGDNSADWAHNGKDVREIRLPMVNHGQFDPTSGESFAVENSNATVVYEQLCCTDLFPIGSSAFKGQFVSGSDNRSPGVAVMGTYSIGSGNTLLLNGSFGAEHVGTNAATLPSSTSTVIHASVHDDSGSITTTALTIEDPDHIYALSSLTGRTAANKRATIRLRNTSLTRFGAWTLVGTDSANPSMDSGIFTYSQLAPTSYGGANADYIPRRGSAHYAGRTVAVDSTGDLYDGTYRLGVTWSTVSGATSGTISAAISGLSGFTLGGVAVTQIGFRHDNVSSAATGFTSPAATTVQYATNSQAVPFGSGTHVGTFLGNQGPNGPYAVVGSWSLTDTTPDPDYTITGAFGADLVRAP